MLVALLCALLLAVPQASAEEMKLGYINLELILAMHPQSKVNMQTLAGFEQKLQQELQAKNAHLDQKVTEYANTLKAGAAKDATKEAELYKLDEEVQKFAQDAEYKLAKKQAEVTEPLIQHIDTAIQDLAKEKGYTYVFNSVDSGGVSILVFGPESHDLTRALAEKVGIKLKTE